MPKKTILIIEDETALARVLTDRLGEAGYDVVTAKDGEDGLEKALEKHPDLILLDILLPKFDGQELLKRLRKDKWGKNARVILATNVGTIESINESMAAGVTDYFVKSETSLDDIVDIVKNKLG